MAEVTKDGTSNDVHFYSGFENWLCTYKRWCPRIIDTLPVLHFKRFLTTDYSETTAHFNGNFDTDNKIYAP
jgi:hypothetical protein